MPLLAVFILLFSTVLAHGFSHGNPRFSPAQWGGSANVACITAVIASVCDTGYNATCNGSGTNDTAAVAAFRTAATAANPTQAVLYIPPGSNCKFTGDQRLTNGIQNVVVWMYGATLDIIAFGADKAFFDDTSHNALTQTWNIGDSNVTLVTAADSAIFTVGHWVAASCITTQVDGYPPNFNRFNYRTVTSITGTTTKVIGLSSPLDISCKSTYPQVGVGTTGGQGPKIGGAANLYELDQNWNTTAVFHGGTIYAASTYQLNVVGRAVTLINTNMWTMPNNAASLNPTASGTIVLQGLFAQGSMEIDKDVDTLNIYQSHLPGFNFDFQSASTNNTRIEASSAERLNGTTTNTTIINSTFASTTKVGPLSSGHGQTATFTGSTINGPATAQIEILASTITYSSGVFSLLKSDGSIPSFISLIPDTTGKAQYKLGYHNSFASSCTPLYTFRITDISEDATKFYATSNTWTNAGSSIATPAALPSPTCAGAMYIVAYPAGTITQTNSSPGDLTQFAPP